MIPTKLRLMGAREVPARLQLTEAQHAELEAWGARHPDLWAPRPPEPGEYAARRDAYREYHVVSARERPGSHRREPAAVTDAQVAAYVAADPAGRGHLQTETVRALIYLASFRPCAHCRDSAPASGAQ